MNRFTDNSRMKPHMAKFLTFVACVWMLRITGRGRGLDIGKNYTNQKGIRRYALQTRKDFFKGSIAT